MDYRQLQKAIVDRILEGEGTLPKAQRHAAFDNANLEEPLRGLIEKVAYHSYKITDAEVEAVKKAGLSEDQIFELVICGAVGQAARQYHNAIKTLDKVVGEMAGHGHAS